MATSGTVAFRPNVEEVITEAFERCGIDAQTRTGDHARSARRSLNLLFSEFSNRGINYWTVTQNSLTLVSGTTNYTLPAGTIDLLDVVVRDTSTNIDQIINRITIEVYNQIPDKTNAGKPSQYMVDRQYTPVIYLWSVPNVSTLSLNYWAMNQQEDITASNQDTDIPYRWTDTICAGLSSKLAMKYAPDRIQMLKAIYEEEFTRAANEDVEKSSYSMVPKQNYIR